MSILNKAILTGGPRYGRCFLCYGPSGIKSSVPQADSAIAALEKIQLNFSGKSDREILRCKINDDGYERHVITFSDAGRGKVAPGADLNRWSLFRESLYPLALIVLTGARFLQIRTLLPVITPLQ